MNDDDYDALYIRMNVQKWCPSNVRVKNVVVGGGGSITFQLNFKISFWSTCVRAATSLLPYGLISRWDIPRFTSFLLTRRLARILVLNDARTLPVDFLLCSEAEALTSGSSFSLLHCAAAGGGVADAWSRGCERAWVVPVRLLHRVHVGPSLGVLARAWAYEALRGVTFPRRCDSVAVLRRRAEGGRGALDTCTCCTRTHSGSTRGEEGAISVLAHAPTTVRVGCDIIFIAEVDLREGSAS